jgi:hypothetical protein
MESIKLEKQKSQNVILNVLEMIYKLVATVSGIILVILNLFPEVKSQTVIIVGIIYFTTAVILLLSSKWERIYYSRFLRALKQAGITGVYQNKRANFARIIEALSGESEWIGEVINVKIIACNSHDLLRSTETLLRDVLSNNEIPTRIRIIIAEKDGKYINDVWDLESEHYKETIAKTQKTGKDQHDEAFDIIKRLYGLSKITMGEFGYKRFTTQARYSIIIINNKWAWWTPYHPGIKVPETVSFILEKKEQHDNTTIIRHCIGHFKDLWEKLPDPPPGEITGSSGTAVVQP